MGWAGETELDVEYAHTIAPGANILLVETPTSENEGTTGFPQIVKAEKYVVSHHLGGVISQSFSATEQSFATPSRLLNLRGAYIRGGGGRASPCWPPRATAARRTWSSTARPTTCTR